jgi:hypothetical protein
MHWIEAAILSVALSAIGVTISWAIVRAFTIKYSDAKHNQSLQQRLDKLEAIIENVGADKIAALELDVQALKNINNLTARVRR